MNALPLTAGLDKTIAALPDAVDAAMRKALPNRYTPALAREFADTMAAVLTGQQPAGGAR